MRIIAGKLRSLKIQAPEGKQTTRPTADRIKEAVFSSIGPYFYGGSVLDCYGGSGSISFEALSRGMEKADIFETDKNAVKCIQNNAERLKLASQIRLHECDVMKNLSELTCQYDLIYIDPPYKKQHNRELIQKISELDLLSEKGMLIVESLKEDFFDEKIGQYVLIKKAIYGITKISYYGRQR